jgi:hypothetical protein
MKSEQKDKRARRGRTLLDKLDAYELPPEIPLASEKMKPNRFAGRVQLSHGGKRAGAGRKPGPEAIERHTVTLFKSQADYLRLLDSNLSKAIRALIERSR